MDTAFSCFNRKSLETILPQRGAALKKIDGVFYSSTTPDRMTGSRRFVKTIRTLKDIFPEHLPIQDMPRMNSSASSPRRSFRPRAEVSQKTLMSSRRS